MGLEVEAPLLLRLEGAQRKGVSRSRQSSLKQLSGPGATRRDAPLRQWPREDAEQRGGGAAVVDSREAHPLGVGVGQGDAPGLVPPRPRSERHAAAQASERYRHPRCSARAIRRAPSILSKRTTLSPHE